MVDFLLHPDYEKIFILDGYAGTGKTALIAAFVRALKGLKTKTVLLAPTGRAAKVMGQYAGQKALTIHKKIYRQKSLTDPDARFMLDYNKERDTVFIVDEASMLANYSVDSAFGSGNLLEDLITYVRRGSRCRLIFVGDNAQLPPVGSERSPSLDAPYMSRFGDIQFEILDEVVRQQDESGILFNATLVRCMLEADIVDIPLFNTSFPDVNRVNGGEILEAIQDAYEKYGMDETLIITRSNKRANRFNEAIRRNVLYAEEEVGSGDRIMIVKNNYFFAEKNKVGQDKALPQNENKLLSEKVVISGGCPTPDTMVREKVGITDSGMDFIANGDTAEIRRIRRFEEFYGFRFADATLRFPDHDEMELDCKILLDTLSSESPALTRDQNNQLFHGVAEDYAEILQKNTRYKKVRENEHFNALQIKFAYAVTCHKAQGGQWKCVFIDKMLFGEESITRDLMQWLYTAITRATEKVYFINFDDKFFETP